MPGGAARSGTGPGATFLPAQASNATMPNPMPTAEPELIDRARSGDRAAHAALYERFAPMVYTLARRVLASPAAAEDVLHDTFIDVLSKLGSFRGESELGYWIRRIAVNRCLMLLRSGWNARRAAEEPDDALLVELPARISPERAIDLEQALAALPDVARAVVWLHDVEGYTHREIGRMMGRTTSFSKSQLARAHERLRALLEIDTTRSEQEPCTPALKTC
jgi:RNA polymerase sigma factor (sigma-70 family)